ncbi:MAG: DEAD/DEAH box helicase family protein [Myxococcota bacterium]
MTGEQTQEDALGLRFVGGTLEIRGAGEHDVLPPVCRFDPRTECHRAPALAYAEVVRALVAAGRAFDDQAKGYAELSLSLRVRREARPFQRQALEAWIRMQRRGVVVLPTGAGKTYVGVLALQACQRSTLVVAPTLDLVHQW